MKKLIIDPHNCSREEYAELKKYLDDASWDYKPYEAEQPKHPDEYYLMGGGACRSYEEWQTGDYTDKEFIEAMNKDMYDLYHWNPYAEENQIASKLIGWDSYEDLNKEEYDKLKKLGL
jgi:hypothetical protein